MFKPLIQAALVCGPMILPALAQAEDRIWSVQQAFDAAARGAVILLDIRTEEEWTETGVGQGAWPVSMHVDRFGMDIRRILAGNPDTPIALICATGGRSDYLARLFRQNNIPNVIDIGEGMMGSGHGPGWLKSGLPVVSAAAALAAMPGDMIQHVRG